MKVSWCKWIIVMFFVIIARIHQCSSTVQPSLVHTTPKDDLDSEESRQVLGSSVVTSVSVIMGHNNGTKTFTGNNIDSHELKTNAIASPGNLLNPDRYEFYTFDEAGDLIKRLMTWDEIQSLIAGSNEDSLLGESSVPMHYSENMSDRIASGTQLTANDFQSTDIQGVHKVVESVQNVLKSELAASQSKIPPVAKPGLLSGALNWSLFLPTLLDNVDDAAFDLNNLPLLPAAYDSTLRHPNLTTPSTPLSTTNEYGMKPEKPVRFKVTSSKPPILVKTPFHPPTKRPFSSTISSTPSNPFLKKKPYSTSKYSYWTTDDHWSSTRPSIQKNFTSSSKAPLSITTKFFDVSEDSTSVTGVPSSTTRKWYGSGDISAAPPSTIKHGTSDVSPGAPSSATNKWYSSSDTSFSTPRTLSSTSKKGYETSDVTTPASQYSAPNKWFTDNSIIRFRNETPSSTKKWYSTSDGSASSTTIKWHGSNDTTFTRFSSYAPSTTNKWFSTIDDSTRSPVSWTLTSKFPHFSESSTLKHTTIPKYNPSNVTSHELLSSISSVLNQISDNDKVTNTFHLNATETTPSVSIPFKGTAETVSAIISINQFKGTTELRKGSSHRPPTIVSIHTVSTDNESANSEHSTFPVIHKFSSNFTKSTTEANLSNRTLSAFIPYNTTPHPSTHQTEPHKTTTPITFIFDNHRASSKTSTLYTHRASSTTAASAASYTLSAEPTKFTTPETRRPSNDSRPQISSSFYIPVGLISSSSTSSSSSSSSSSSATSKTTKPYELSTPIANYVTMYRNPTAKPTIKNKTPHTNSPFAPTVPSAEIGPTVSDNPLIRISIKKSTALDRSTTTTIRPEPLVTWISTSSLDDAPNKISLFGVYDSDKLVTELYASSSRDRLNSSLTRTGSTDSSRTASTNTGPHIESKTAESAHQATNKFKVSDYPTIPYQLSDVTTEMEMQRVPTVGPPNKWSPADITRSSSTRPHYTFAAADSAKNITQIAVMLNRPSESDNKTAFENEYRNKVTHSPANYSTKPIIPTLHNNCVTSSAKENAAESVSGWNSHIHYYKLPASDQKENSLIYYYKLPPVAIPGHSTESTPTSAILHYTSEAIAATEKPYTKFTTANRPDDLLQEGISAATNLLSYTDGRAPNKEVPAMTVNSAIVRVTATAESVTDTQSTTASKAESRTIEAATTEFVEPASLDGETTYKAPGNSTFDATTISEISATGMATLANTNIGYVDFRNDLIDIRNGTSDEDGDNRTAASTTVPVKPVIKLEDSTNSSTPFPTAIINGTSTVRYVEVKLESKIEGEEEEEEKEEEEEEKKKENRTTPDPEGISAALSAFRSPSHRLPTSTLGPIGVELHPAPYESMGLEASTAYLGDDVKRFVDLCNELSFKIWTTQMAKSLMTSRSVVLSPFAALSSLAMIFLGARGSSSGVMNDFLKLDDMVTFNPHQVLKNITASALHPKNVGVANSALVREIFADKTKGKVLDFYKERLQQYYDTHVEEINFNSIGDLVRKRTNMLVKRQTHGRIQDYLKGSALVLRPPLAILTANLFQTDCELASTEGRDGEMYFVVRPSTRQRRLVPIPAVVYRSGFLAGYEPGLDATAVTLSPESMVSTILVLPGQQGQVAPGDGLARLEQRLLESSYRRGAWSRLLRSLLFRPGLELQVPRFSHKSVLNLTSGLQKMGMEEIFEAGEADLRGINGVLNDLHLSDMVQVNTFSTCGEIAVGARHHSETYPPASQRVGRSSNNIFDRSYLEDSVSKYYSSLPLNLRPRQARLPDNPRLRFDRPFLYIARHNTTGMILYVGRFNPRLLP